MVSILTQFGPEIWLAEGRTVTATAGFHYPTHMAVIRLSGNRLFIWSPVALTADLQAAVSALGEVGYLIPPNSLHHLFLRDWQRAFPQAKTLPRQGYSRNDLISRSMVTSPASPSRPGTRM